MNRHVGTLLAILLIQSAMVALVYWPEPDGPERESAEPLITFDLDLIDEISVEDDQGNEAVLLKMADRWLLPDLAGLPVDEAMVEQLIDSLGSRAGLWPIATTDSSRQRFRVASYLYQRRLRLIASGELLGTIYLGTSPNFRQVHARRDAREDIYRIAYNIYEAPPVTSAWMDKKLLQTSEPTAIESPGFSLVKRGERWVSATEGKPDERELAALLLALASVQIDGLADEDMQRSLAIAAPEMTLKTTTAEDSTTVSVFSIGSRHFIRSNKFDYFFTLSAYDYDRLVGIDPRALAGQP